MTPKSEQYEKEVGQSVILGSYIAGASDGKRKQSGERLG
jgi:hypothetical protein